MELQFNNTSQPIAIHSETYKIFLPFSPQITSLNDLIEHAVEENSIQKI